MKNTYILGIVILLLLVIGGFFLNNSNSTGNVVKNTSSDAEFQKIVIGMKNYNYFPNKIEVEVNKPVEITLDSSVYGCFRAFRINELGVSKNSKSPEDKIIFTPKKTGTFKFACSMGMGVGTIIVK